MPPVGKCSQPLILGHPVGHEPHGKWNSLEPTQRQPLPSGCPTCHGSQGASRRDTPPGRPGGGRRHHGEGRKEQGPRAGRGRLTGAA